MKTDFVFLLVGLAVVRACRICGKLRPSDAANPAWTKPRRDNDADGLLGKFMSGPVWRDIVVGWAMGKHYL